MSEYKRLTTKDKDGNWQVWEDDYSHPFEALQVAIDRLAEYEDDEENGKIVRLPCKVGDKVYVVYRFPDCWEEPDFEYDISVEKVHDIIITEDGFDIGTECCMIGKFERICVCITREEAEKRLKELQE